MPMKISSGGRELSSTKARNSVLINQLATPGLGSLLAGRYLAGTGQLLLALIGAGLVMCWAFGLMAQTYRAIEGDAEPKPIAWVGELGAVIFAVSWLWSLVTSISLLREARANEASSQPQPPKLN